MPPKDWEYGVCWCGWQSRELAAALLADSNPLGLLELFSLSPFLQGTKVSFRQESVKTARPTSPAPAASLPDASCSPRVLAPTVPSCIPHIHTAMFNKSAAQTLK